MNRLKEIRVAQGRPQAEVAAAADIVYRSYIRYETDAALPNVLSAIRIADALHVVDLRKIWYPVAFPQ